MNKAETGGVTAGDAAAGDAAAGDDAAGDSTAGDSAAGDAAAGDSTAGDDAAGDSTASDDAAGDATAGDAEVCSRLGLTKAPPTILLQTALSAPLAPTSIPDSLTRTCAEMDVVRSFHTQASRAVYHSIIPPYQVREHVNSIEDVQAALTQGVCSMQARRL